MKEWNVEIFNMILHYLLVISAGLLINTSSANSGNKACPSFDVFSETLSHGQMRSKSKESLTVHQRYYQAGQPTILLNSLKLLLIVFLIYLTLCSIYQNSYLQSSDDDDDDY